MTERTYPHQSADVTVIGPECFASHPAPDDEGVVLCWRGRNFTPAPPPAAEPQCRWHRSRCETPSALCLVDCAPSPAAEPPHDLREELAQFDYEQSSDAYIDPPWSAVTPIYRSPFYRHADRLLTGPLAPLLARLTRAEAAVQRVEALAAKWEELIAHYNAPATVPLYRSAAELRAALASPALAAGLSPESVPS